MAVAHFVLSAVRSFVAKHTSHFVGSALFKYKQSAIEVAHFFLSAVKVNPISQTLHNWF